MGKVTFNIDGKRELSGDDGQREPETRRPTISDTEEPGLQRIEDQPDSEKNIRKRKKDEMPIPLRRAPTAERERGVWEIINGKRVYIPKIGSA